MPTFDCAGGAGATSKGRPLTLAGAPTGPASGQPWTLEKRQWSGAGNRSGALRFLHPRRLALQAAQEVQLGAADARRADDIDLGDRRRVQREDALDALAERH